MRGAHLNRPALFVIVSAVCFAVALLAALGAISANADDFAFGGALAYVLASL